MADLIRALAWLIFHGSEMFDNLNSYKHFA